MNLPKFLFVLSILGIFFLIGISKFTEPKAMNINESSFPSSQISIQGKIEKINSYSSSSIIYLENSSLEVVAFTNYLELKKGNQVEILGRPEQYKNKTQLIVDKITCLDC